MFKFAILGFPLGHSISPVIHKRFLNELGLHGRYQKIEIPDTDFEQRINQLKKGHWQGFNVTVPHKQRIIPYLDEVETIAQKIGAVNTVKIQNDGKWIGHNSDYLGFLKPLQNNNYQIRKVLIIGAGGAARAVAFGLLKEYPVNKMVIINRTLQRASDLIGKLKNFRQTDYQAVTFENALETTDHFDLIVNTTSVGMGQSSMDLSIDPMPFAHSNSLCYDLIYNPLKTRFLQIAENNGLQIMGGLPMLLYQAAASYKIWTGKTVPQNILTELMTELPAIL